MSFIWGGVQTDIKPGYFYGYRTKSVGAKMYNGELVGWTHVYGIARDYPEDYSWMEAAYIIDEKKVKISTLKL